MILRFNFCALALTCSFLSSPVISANPDPEFESDKQQWSYKLAQPLPPEFKGYVLESDSDPWVIKKLAKFAGIAGGNLDAKISISDSTRETTTVEFVFSNPAASGNITSTTFVNSTFSLDSSVIRKSDGNIPTTNKVDIDITYDEESGRYIRVIMESLTSVQTRLLDATAPIVDQNSFFMLMRGANKNPDAYDKKPVYFFINGLIRQYQIVHKKTDTIKENTLGIRFDLEREGQTIGSIWVEAGGDGNPLRFKIGKLLYNVKVAP